MAVYQFRCEAHGVFDTSHPIGTAPPSRLCPTCLAAAARVWSAPHLASSPARVALIERTERTGERPEVVSDPPPPRRRGRNVTTDPNHRRLPRP